MFDAPSPTPPHNLHACRTLMYVQPLHGQPVRAMDQLSPVLPGGSRVAPSSLVVQLQVGGGGDLRDSRHLRPSRDN